jgi:hypothetical protein
MERGCNTEKGVIVHYCLIAGYVTSPLGSSDFPSIKWGHQAHLYLPLGLL